MGAWRYATTRHGPRGHFGAGFWAGVGTYRSRPARVIEASRTATLHPASRHHVIAPRRLYPHRAKLFSSVRGSTRHRARGSSSCHGAAVRRLSVRLTTPRPRRRVTAPDGRQSAAAAPTAGWATPPSSSGRLARVATTTTTPRRTENRDCRDRSQAWPDWRPRGRCCCPFRRRRCSMRRTAPRCCPRRPVLAAERCSARATMAVAHGADVPASAGRSSGALRQKRAKNSRARAEVRAGLRAGARARARWRRKLRPRRRYGGICCSGTGRQT